MIKIDWDNFEVIEAEDYTVEDLNATIEDVREYLDSMDIHDNVYAESLLEDLAAREHNND